MMKTDKANRIYMVIMLNKQFKSCLLIAWVNWQNQRN